MEKANKIEQIRTIVDTQEEYNLSMLFLNTQVKLSLNDIYWIFEDFAKNYVKNPEFSERLLKNLFSQNKNIVITIIKKPFYLCPENARIQTATLNEIRLNNLKFNYPFLHYLYENSTVGAISEMILSRKSNQQYAEIVLPLGRKNILKQTYNTTLGKLGTIAHELGHSITEKYYTDISPYRRCEEIQEIESQFVEKMFYHYLTERADFISGHFKTIKHSKLDFKELKDAAKYYDKYCKCYIAQNGKTILDNNLQANTDIPKYPLGQIYSSVLFDSFKSNEEKTMRHFMQFIKASNKMPSADYAANILFCESDIIKTNDNRVTTFDVVNYYKKSVKNEVKNKEKTM